MRIKILNSSTGCFSLNDPTKKSFMFSLGLLDDENKIIEVDGLKAVMRYNGDVDDEWCFKYLYENFENIFDMCYEYCCNIWSSSVDYKGECLLFVKFYQKNFKEINDKMVKEYKEMIQEEIKELQIKILSTKEGMQCNSSHGLKTRGFPCTKDYESKRNIR